MEEFSKVAGPILRAWDDQSYHRNLQWQMFEAAAREQKEHNRELYKDGCNDGGWITTGVYPGWESQKMWHYKELPYTVVPTLPAYPTTVASQWSSDNTAPIATKGITL